MARALYIHWPFCAKKCPYCDFNSHVRAGVDEHAWRSALIADMRSEATITSGNGPLTSVFFGGGTPSLMSPALVGDLLDEAARLWGFDPAIEITLEANPSSVETANFAALSNAGVNRVSLGIQSLEDKALKWLGRLHSADEALRALDTAQSHFRRVSFDLIYALPNQSPDLWQKQLTRALSFGSSHLSLYQLTIEPGTRFATDVRHGLFSPLNDDAAGDLYNLTRILTSAAGMPAYETSNHAKPGQESRHNLTYWRYQDYCGIGPGGHGRRAGQATTRHKKPENYLAAVETKGHGISENYLLSQREQGAEALLMGLRLAEGIKPQDLAQRFDLDPLELLNPKKVVHYHNLGLLWQEQSRIGVTAKGSALLDALLGEIVGDALVTG